LRPKNPGTPADIPGDAAGTVGLGSRTAPVAKPNANLDLSPEPRRIGERADFGKWVAALTDALEERRELSRTASLE
jgi:hypothetical protein